MTGRTLIAGVGNIFLGDDGFGVEVARRLATAGLPDRVTVADYGTSGMHLAYDLAAGFGTTIIIDAAPRGGEPGTITVLEAEPGQPEGTQPGPPGVPGQPEGAAGLGPPEGAGAAGPPAPLSAGRMFDAHGMQPDQVLSVLGMLGAPAGRILVVGCEPASTGYRIGLSEPVTAAVDEAVRIVLDLVAGTLSSGGGEHEGASHVPRHSG